MPVTCLLLVVDMERDRLEVNLKKLQFESYLLIIRWR